jgi:hypothetical protein
MTKPMGILIKKKNSCGQFSEARAAIVELLKDLIMFSTF